MRVMLYVNLNHCSCSERKGGEGVYAERGETPSSKRGRAEKIISVRRREIPSINYKRKGGKRVGRIVWVNLYRDVLRTRKGRKGTILRTRGGSMRAQSARMHVERKKKGERRRYLRGGGKKKKSATKRLKHRSCPPIESTRSRRRKKRGRKKAKEAFHPPVVKEKVAALTAGEVGLVFPPCWDQGRERGSLFFSL